MKRLYSLIITTSVLLITMDCVFAYDPPEIIGVLRGVGEDSLRFGENFCCVGDQNGDGYDDLLVLHTPRREGQGSVDMVKLYFGGEEVDNQPDLIFNVKSDDDLGERFVYLGDLTGENTSWICIYSLIRLDGEIWGKRIYLFEGGDQLDTLPEVVLTRPLDSGIRVGRGLLSKPSDFNGDGFDDLIMAQAFNDSLAKILIFHGGEEFDTIPDWEATVSSTLNINSIDFAPGEDVNNDGYDDVIVMHRTNEHVYWFALFLGGSPMDTVPVMDYSQLHFEDRNIIRNSMYLLPDVNGDGYADWVHYYRRVSSERDGYLLFFGSEHPDADFDLDLEGTHALVDQAGGVVGGYFSGDEFGDIFSVNPHGYVHDGEINLYFGSPQMDADADAIFITAEEYGDDLRSIGTKLGAVGDYNGDGIDDIVLRHPEGETISPFLVILSGNRAWSVDAPVDQVPERHDLVLNVSPNPFNSNLQIEFTLARRGRAQLSVYDIHGREVEILHEGITNTGSDQVLWHPATSGIYFVRLTFDGISQVRKVVCLQ